MNSQFVAFTKAASTIQTLPQRLAQHHSPQLGIHIAQTLRNHRRLENAQLRMGQFVRHVRRDLSQISLYFRVHNATTKTLSENDLSKIFLTYSASALGQSYL